MLTFRWYIQPNHCPACHPTQNRPPGKTVLFRHQCIHPQTGHRFKFSTFTTLYKRYHKQKRQSCQSVAKKQHGKKPKPLGFGFKSYESKNLRKHTDQRGAKPLNCYASFFTFWFTNDVYWLIGREFAFLLCPFQCGLYKVFICIRDSYSTFFNILYRCSSRNTKRSNCYLRFFTI